MLIIAQSMGDSTHIAIGSLHIEILTFTHIETHEFEEDLKHVL